MPEKEVKECKDNAIINVVDKLSKCTIEDIKKKEAKPAEEKKTPYQGKRRSYGWFYCKKCKKKWTSGNSWKNTFQKCRTCFQEIYPFRQVKLEGRPGTNKPGRPPHPSDLCGMCLRLGTKCYESAF